MKPKTIILAVVGVALVAVLVSVLMKPASAGIVNVDAAGAEKAIAEGAQIIDIRTPGEFQMGHIPGAINVPQETLEQAAASWDRNATYLVYCATGSRSTTAVETLKSMGFGNIRHYASGIQSWAGQIETGSASSETSKIETSGKPVVIEFFTDS